MIDMEGAPPYIAVIEETEERISSMRAADAAQLLNDGMFWDNEGPGFSCSEAEAIATLMYHAGVDLRTCADLVVTGHGQPGRSEDSGDDHWHAPHEEDHGSSTDT